MRFQLDAIGQRRFRERSQRTLLSLGHGLEAESNGRTRIRVAQQGDAHRTNFKSNASGCVKKSAIEHDEIYDLARTQKVLPGGNRKSKRNSKDCQNGDPVEEKDRPRDRIAEQGMDLAESARAGQNAGAARPSLAPRMRPVMIEGQIADLRLDEE